MHGAATRDLRFSPTPLRKQIEWGGKLPVALLHIFPTPSVFFLQPEPGNASDTAGYKRKKTRLTELRYARGPGL